MRDFESDWYGSEHSVEDQGSLDDAPLIVRTLVRIVTLIVAYPIAAVVVLLSPKGRLVTVVAIAGAVVWAFVSSPLTATAEGEVVGLSSLGCCRGTIGFTDMNGDTHEFFSPVAGRGREVGEAVDVFYNPDDPTEVDITKITDWMWLGLYALSLVILIPAAAPLMRRMGDWERRHWGYSGLQ